MTVRLEGGLELTARSTDAVVAAPGEACLVRLDPEAIVVWVEPTT